MIPETFDAIRALTEAEPEAAASIRKTNAALGITGRLVETGSHVGAESQSS